MQENYCMPDFFSNLPQIKTERLILRPLTTEDADDVFFFTSQPETTLFLTWEPHAFLSDTIKFIQHYLDKAAQGNPTQWGIELTGEKKIIGITGFIDFSLEHHKGEIAFVLSADYRGHGLMKEANRAVFNFGFTAMQLNRIQAKVEVENIASQNMLVRSGMKKEGVLRNFLYRKDKVRDYIMYSILITEF